MLYCINWQTKNRIAIGIEKGLAIFSWSVNTESYIHCDVNARNTLLDNELIQP